MPLIQKFISDRRGNVAMMFGLAALSLFGIGGLALDYTRATQLQAKVAAAADAAALAAAKTEGSEGDRKKVAEDVFNAAIASLGGVKKLQLKGKDIKDGSTVTAFRVEASLEMDTMVGALVGQGKLPIGTSSQATLGGTEKFEIALVLDTTGSMQGANTKSAQYPDHWGTDAATANTITSEVCANINAAPAGIKVYTIAFEVTDPTIKSILQSCAVSADRFFDAADSTQLSAAFQKIATSLAKLRLEK